MMGLRLILLCLALLAPAMPAQAQPGPMTAAEFEAYVTGRTLTYAANGVPYGVEEYLEGRRVRWSFLGEECKHGYWYESDGYICFEYEDGIGPQCWTFYADESGLSAQFRGDDPGSVLYEVGSSDESLQCTGPKVGA